ncbi:hypothetical protein GCM10023081_46700 [Arthrobacter ginkgonis]|uniref:Uncharacterized protein n=1 Tax=Arthrobacter ginkgonis TaxID=1630594 RepID=A0ABP7DGF1_9MICC
MVALPAGSASYGYDGSADETAFHKIMDYSASSRYGVNTPGAFKATNVAGQALQISLAAGTAWTAGVIDIMPTAQTVQLNAATSTRWDLVVLRRDWQPTIGVTTIEVIQGTSAKALPSRNNNGGVLDDQPLWLLRIEPGQSVPAEFVDLRLWARNGGCTANDDLVRSYLSTTGASVEINGVLWLYRVGANGTNEWVKPVELAMAADSSSSSTGAAGKLVRRDSNHRFGILDPVTATHPASKGYVDFEIQDHGHHALTSEGDGIVLFVGSDSRGKYVDSDAIRARTYDEAPNMYIGSDGKIGRSTNAPTPRFGTVSVPLSSSAGSDGFHKGTINVNIPSGVFDQTPVVFVSALSEAPELIGAVTAHDRTKTGFLISVARRTGTTTTVAWWAVTS